MIVVSGEIPAPRGAVAGYRHRGIGGIACSISSPRSIAVVEWCQRSCDEPVCRPHEIVRADVDGPYRSRPKRRGSSVQSQ